MNNSSLTGVCSDQFINEVNRRQENSCFTIQDPLSTVNCLNSQINSSISQYPSEKNQNNMQSRKPYFMKTCKYIDKKTLDIPFKKMFLTSLDFLIVESSSEMNQLTKNKFLSSFNYFKRVVNIERNDFQDWIRVNLSYVSMKKLPIKVMQQRLCNSKQKTGSEISDLLHEDLLNYNRTFQSSKGGFRLIDPAKIEKNLNNKYSLYFEIEHQGNQSKEIERLIYDFNVKSICFSSYLAKFLIGDSSNLVHYLSSSGIPEIYSSKTEYFDFWKKRLGTTGTKRIKSTLQSIDGFDFECEEKISFYQHSENGLLIIQIIFDFDQETPSNQCMKQKTQNIHKFIKSERKQVENIMKSQKISFLTDPLVTQVFQDEYRKKIQSKPIHLKGSSPLTQNKPQISSLSSVTVDIEKADNI